MYDRLISYMLKHNILFEYQFGFQKGKSTHMALITHWTMAIMLLVSFLISTKLLTLLIMLFYWIKCLFMGSEL